MIETFLLLLVFVVGDDTCSRKTSEATCGSGCRWENTTGGSCTGSCVGTPSCVAADIAKCGGTAGCTWVDAVAAGCGGTAECSGQTTTGSCSGGEFGLGGCSWATPMDSTCTGSITKCEPTLTQSVCEAINGCKYEEVLSGCRYKWNSCWDYFDYCSSINGCTMLEQTGTCTGDTIITECENILDTNKCYELGCRRERNQTCFGTATIPECSEIGLQENCMVFGCTWSNGVGCTGTPTRTKCEDFVGFNMARQYCEETGCTYEEEVSCTGGTVSPLYTQCSEILSGRICLGLGCSGMTEHECSGTLDNSEFNTIGSKDDCDALGISFLGWFDHSTTCKNSSLNFPATTQCDVFASDEDSCRNVGCSYTPASGGCSGTSLDACSSFAQNRCDVITGCTYTAEVAAHCGGTASLTACTEATGEDVCTSINGCVWNVNSCSLLGQEMCTGTCTWTQPGVCTAESQASSLICVPAMLMLLLMVLLL